MKILKAFFVPFNIGKRCFVSNNKMKRCLFGILSFLTHGRFVSLRNFILVSNNTMKGSVVRFYNKKCTNTE